MREMPNRADGPTPEEIHRMCAEIREGWSESEYLLREVEKRRAWCVPEAKNRIYKSERA